MCDNDRWSLVLACDLRRHAVYHLAFFFFQAEDGIRDKLVTGVQTCALPILSTPYSYLAMTKRSIYVDHHTHDNQESKRLTIVPGKSKYIFVYPFLKTRGWFLLTKAARQGMMDEHIEVGHRFPSVKLNTTYSFGLDDQEWVVAFESDKPEDFLDLVMALRETEGSRYTLRDTPIFTCVHKSLKEALDTLGG